MKQAQDISAGITARAIVAEQFMLNQFDGHEIVLDLRNEAEEFLSSVNETQINVIRNRQQKNKLKYFCNLPAAAKEFVHIRLKDRLQGLKEHGYSEALKLLDIACWRHEILTGETSLTSSVRKRWVSGFFVLLPVDAIPIAIERAEFMPSHINNEYWKRICLEAEKIGPPSV